MKPLSRVLVVLVGTTLSALAIAMLAGAADGQWLLGAAAILIPTFGLASLLYRVFSDEGIALGAGAAVWSGMVILGAPAWIERDQAWARAEVPAEILAVLEQLPAAERPIAAAPPPCDCADESFAVSPVEERPVTTPQIVDEDEGDLVVLPYEGTASSMRLPLSIEKDGVYVDTELIFDTGATLTAINPRILDELGVKIDPNAPTIRTQTANGLRDSPLIFIDRIWLGGFEIEGVTATLCDNCGSMNGLLGLNVSSNFKVEVDQARRELLFRPVAEPDRHLDVKSWLRYRMLNRGGRRHLVSINEGPRDVRDARVEARCGDDAIEVTLGEIPSGGESEAVPIPGLDCDRSEIRLQWAQW
ncbi:MAG: retropepsin-like aspartic protease [Myxococcota bacterium]